MIRVLIVDDEPAARHGLRVLLQNEVDMAVVGESSDGYEALTAIREQAPDLVFLDVQMPGLDGFGVISALPVEDLPAVVFVTAYDRHALKAFDVNAVDYLLKPFDRDRFKLTLDRVRQHLEGSSLAEVRRNLDSVVRAMQAADRGPERTDRLAVRDRDRIRFLSWRDIAWIEVRGNYLRVHTDSGSHLVRATLTAMSERLAGTSFVQISQSNIVNTDQVEQVHVLQNGRFELLLTDGTTLLSSRRYRKDLEALWRRN